MLLLESLEDVHISGVELPATTPVLLLTRHAATLDTSFARPTIFDPERWLNQRDAPQRSRGFLTFGAGPRFCPGRNLAFLEAKAGLALLARNFEITLDPGARPVTEQFSFTTVPRGLRVRLRQRSLA
jgi:cytochrome P450